MSHSQGRIKFPSGHIGYLEYNGTSDVMLPNIFETETALLEQWRKQEWKYCKDKNHTHIEVEIATSYGNGFSWPAKACVECNILVDNLMPYEAHFDTGEPIKGNDGIPEWWPSREKWVL